MIEQTCYFLVKHVHVCQLFPSSNSFLSPTVSALPSKQFEHPRSQIRTGCIWGPSIIERGGGRSTMSGGIIKAAESSPSAQPALPPGPVEHSRAAIQPWCSRGATIKQTGG